VSPGTDSLDRGEERFIQIVEGLDEAVWLQETKTHQIIYVSPACERLFGFSQEDVSRDPSVWLRTVHPQDRERLTRMLFEPPALQQEDVEYRIVRPDSAVRWLHVRTRPVRDAEGQVYRSVGIARDVTEARRALEERRSTEARYKNLFEKSPASLWELDLSTVKADLDSLRLAGVQDLESHLATQHAVADEVFSHACIQDVSAATLELTDARSKDQILDSPLLSVMYDCRPALIRGLARLYGGAASFESAARMRTFTGRSRDIVLKISLDEPFRPRWDEVLMTITDVSEVVRKERALKESEEKFHIMSEQSQIGICIVQDGRVSYANSSFTVLTGFAEGDSMLGTPSDPGKLHPSEAFLRMVRQFGPASEEREVTFDLPEVRFTTADGEARWFNVFLKKLSIGGRPAGMAALVDITEERLAREEARDRQNQLIQADKLASLGVLAAGVAHEINNPNQGIILSSQFVQEAWKDIEQVLDEHYRGTQDLVAAGVDWPQLRTMIPDCLSAIRDSSTRIEAIVSDLTGFARQETSEEPVALDFNLVVKAAITLAASMLKKATRNLVVDLAGHLPPVEGNFQRLEQVAINLLQNSCQALTDTSQGISIRTRFDAERNAVVLEVTDEGKGIAPEDLPQITNPFFTTKRDSGGTGLGLSICATIVGQHKGTMRHESTLGKGTRATVTLPALP
jgi:PAS domain S-box-containing protein